MVANRDQDHADRLEIEKVVDALLAEIAKSKPEREAQFGDVEAGEHAAK